MDTPTQDQTTATSSDSPNGSGPNSSAPNSAAPNTTATNMDSLKNALGNNEMVNKATEFAKARPWASAALVGVVGMAILNTLRGRGGSR